ncbi:MAG: hypothetical protein KAT23_03945, partial [Anaerolineales bacterium]|nr:hypothetical protein [Anaerolineales bacterium]
SSSLEEELVLSFETALDNVVDHQTGNPSERRSIRSYVIHLFRLCRRRIELHPHRPKSRSLPK